jgi:hypothetical protein
MIDLSHYMKPRARNIAPVLCCCLAACGIGTWCAVQAYQQHQLSTRATLLYDAMRAAQVVPPPPKLKPGEQEDQKRWAALQHERAFVWPPLFAAIERASSPDIELLEFQPDKESLSLSLQGEARSQQALVDFLAALARQAVLKNVHLTHQQKKQRDRLETVEFEIHALISN